MNSPSLASVARHLRAGDLVEVKRIEEILATLDAQGTFEALPFMPEMLRFCGKRFRVFKRANKVCDTIDKTGLRRMQRTVLLDGVRCDGGDHGGCQAACMILWKEEWLRLIGGEQAADLVAIESPRHSAKDLAKQDEFEKAYTSLMKHSRCSESSGAMHEVYRCQITELKKASMVLPWWDVRIYIEDVLSRNRRLGEVLSGIFISLFNYVQRLRGGDVYPYLERATLKRTPINPLNLQPGDKVRVKTYEQIHATLDGKFRNRGLYFDVGMARYCGEVFCVGARVTKVIHEKTGEMIHASDDNPMIILDGAICVSDYLKFCPRSEYIFWREIWLEKVS